MREEVSSEFISYKDNFASWFFQWAIMKVMLFSDTLSKWCSQKKLKLHSLPRWSYGKSSHTYRVQKKPDDLVVGALQNKSQCYRKNWARTVKANPINYSYTPAYSKAKHSMPQPATWSCDVVVEVVGTENTKICVVHIRKKALSSKHWHDFITFWWQTKYFCTVM